MNNTLTLIETRIIGCLIEKETTTPEYYPLTLNSLANACNQKSNRYPVMDLEEPEIENAISALKSKKLVWQIMTSGSRVPKYKHDIKAVYGFSDQEIAVMTVLMLRGAQTIGEIKTHSVRLYQFNELTEVETVLQDLMERKDGPFVVHLPRLTGHKERRYAHLLSGEPTSEKDTDANDTLTVRINKLENRLEHLESELEALKEKLIHKEL